MLELLLKLLNSLDSLSKEDKDKVSKYIEELNPQALKGADTKQFKASDWISIFQKELQAANSTPQGRAHVEQMIRDNNSERALRRYKPFFDSIMAGADVATAISQIRQSNKASRDLVPPVAPNPNVLDPQLNNQIAQAQQGSLNALRATEPFRQQIEAGRASDISTARSVSGGQSGAFGSLATAASLRANRAAASIPAMADDIRMRQQQRADNLIGMRQGVLQNEFNNRMQIYNTELEQYNENALAAGQLGQAGRTNLRTALGQLPNVLTRAAGSVMPVSNPYDTQSAQSQQPLSYGDDYDRFRSSVRQSMMDRFRRTNNPAFGAGGVFNQMPSDRLRRTSIGNWQDENFKRFNLY